MDSFIYSIMTESIHFLSRHAHEDQGNSDLPWDRTENRYPPRGHDCMPDETEFAETFQDAQEDLERREKNRNKRRTMMMWKNALDEQ